MSLGTQLFSDNPMQRALRAVRESGHFMRKAVESENLKETLKYSDQFISELRSETLSTKEYYTVFNTVFDELAWLHSNLGAFLKTKKKIDIYEIVQYSKKILPRLYLMIVAGLISIENSGAEPMPIFWDILKHLKGVQHPLRGLMLRYYFLKMVKETIEDKEDDLVLEEVISLYLLNMREMNSLWVRINTLIDDREKRIRQRKDLAMLVGENLMRLSALEGLDVRLYKSLVFPRVIEIILDTKDRVSQEYLFDCLISVFPDDYHLETLTQLLDATEKLGKKVEINAILMKLMERLALFAKNNEKFTEKSSLLNDGVPHAGPETRVSEANFSVSPNSSQHGQSIDGHETSRKNQYHKDYIYHQFKNAIGSMIGKDKAEVHKLLELLAGFMNFTVFFYNGNFEFIDAILKLTKAVCDRYQVVEKLKKIAEGQVSEKPEKEGYVDPKTLEHLVSLLTIPMEKLSILVLKLTEFTGLMDILPDSEQRQVASKICAAIAHSRTQLVTEKIVHSVLLFINPLFNSIDSKDEDLHQVIKMLHFVDSGIPELNIKLLKVFEDRFVRTDRKHLRLVYPVYLNRLIFNISKAAAIKRFLAAAAEENGIDLTAEGALEKLKTEAFRESYKAKFCRFKDAPYLDDADRQVFDIDFQKDPLTLNLHALLEQIHQITKEIEYEHPEVSLGIWLDLMLTIDLCGAKDELDELLYNCSTHVLAIYENESGHSKKRFFNFGRIIGCYGALVNANKATLESIFNHVRAAANLLLTREEQARAMLKVSRLYLKLPENHHAITECISRSSELISMSLKYETVRSNVMVDIFEALNSYMGGGHNNLFEVKNITGCLGFIEKNLKEGQFNAEEATAFKELLTAYLARSRGYWAEHSAEPEVQKILAVGK